MASVRALSIIGLWLFGMSTCNTPESRLGATSPSGPPISATVPLPLATARARLFAALQGNEVPLQMLHHPELGLQFNAFVLYTNEQQTIDYTFRPRPEGDYSERAVPMTTAHLPPGTVEARLLAYIALPAAARAPDLLLGTGRGEFWETREYEAGGTFLPYTCEYLVHFAASGPSATTLEVIGLRSRVHNGKEWRFTADQDGLGLPRPQRLPRSRNVLPSVSDKQQVLAQLVKLVK